MRLKTLAQRLQLQMWLIPGLFGMGAVVLAAVLVTVDSTVDYEPTQLPFLFGGNAEGARSMLSTIATAMLSFTGLVFTVTMLVLQLASTQHSPRVLRAFLRDRKNQVVLGIFVATFLFTLVVLRQTRGGEGIADEFVPGLSIGVAFLLLIGSVGAFIFYIDHMANAVRATTILDNIASETLGALEDLFPEPVGEPVDQEAIERPPGEPKHRVAAGQAGVITAVDAGRLIDAASTPSARDAGTAGRAATRFLEMVPMIGDYVTPESTVFRIWGDWTEPELDKLRRSLHTGPERTVQQDVAFGLRQLVDVAQRALSPSMNDPTTAVQAIDRIHEVLQRLSGRAIPSPVRRDEAGTARLLLPRPEWDDYVLLALEEVRLAGRHQPQVMRRLRQMLTALLASAPLERQAVLRRQLILVDEVIEATFTDPLDRRSGALHGGVAGQPSASTLPE